MLQKINQAFQSFADDSSIHGASFIAGKNRSKSTRVFFTMALVCSIGFFIFYVYEATIKWQIEPNIITKVYKRHINEIPFPAFTVCLPLFARDQLANSQQFFKNFVIRKSLRTT
jgi:hypothetical protein